MSPLSASRQNLAFILAILAGAILAACHTATAEPTPPRIGDAPTLDTHTSQADIESGDLTLDQIVERGEFLFTASFNTLDGAGRPETTDLSPDNFRPARTFPDNFNRISGPDANACSSCHGVPRLGGGGDNATNVFILADGFHFVNFDAGEGDGFQSHTLRTVGNERTSLGLFGSGYIELLAREMTEDLHAIRDDARKRARDTAAPVSLPLSTKSVHFGTITASPDGSLDTSRVEGVDPDLVIRPFMQKGTIVSLREFAVKAMNQHFGMQASERFGDAIDHDADGMADELTRGDISALVIFQATLPPPLRVMPDHPEARAAAQRGETLFSTLECSACHIPELPLNNPVFTEPNPFNPAGKLSVFEVANAYTVPLARRRRRHRTPNHPGRNNHGSGLHRPQAPRHGRHPKQRDLGRRNGPNQPVAHPQTLGLRQRTALPPSRTRHPNIRSHPRPRRRSPTQPRRLRQPVRRRPIRRHRIPKNPPNHPRGRHNAVHGIFGIRNRDRLGRDCRPTRGHIAYAAGYPGCAPLLF